MTFQNDARLILHAAIAWAVVALLGGCASPAYRISANDCQAHGGPLSRVTMGCGHDFVRQNATEQPAGRQGHTGQTEVATAVPLKLSGGTFIVPVTINNAIDVRFIVDSGAADVTIPADYVELLIKMGSLSENDFIGKRIFRLANGTTVPAQTFRLNSVQVGGRVLQNVTGSVSIGSGGFLLGQSFLGRFRSWSIDNKRKVLVLN